MAERGLQLVRRCAVERASGQASSRSPDHSGRLASKPETPHFRQLHSVVADSERARAHTQSGGRASSSILDGSYLRRRVTLGMGRTTASAVRHAAVSASRRSARLAGRKVRWEPHAAARGIEGQSREAPQYDDQENYANHAEDETVGVGHPVNPCGLLSESGSRARVSLPARATDTRAARRVRS